MDRRNFLRTGLQAAACAIFLPTLLASCAKDGDDNAQPNVDTTPLGTPEDWTLINGALLLQNTQTMSQELDGMNYTTPNTLFARPKMVLQFRNSQQDFMRLSMEAADGETINNIGMPANVYPQGYGVDVRVRFSSPQQVTLSNAGRRTMFYRNNALAEIMDKPVPQINGQFGENVNLQVWAYDLNAMDYLPVGNADNLLNQYFVGQDRYFYFRNNDCFTDQVSVFNNPITERFMTRLERTDIQDTPYVCTPMQLRLP